MILHYDSQGVVASGAMQAALYASCRANVPHVRMAARLGAALLACLLASVLQAASSDLTPFVSGFSGGRVKQHPIVNPNRHSGEAFGVRTTWG